MLQIINLIGLLIWLVQGKFWLQTAVPSILFAMLHLQFDGRLVLQRTEAYQHLATNR